MAFSAYDVDGFSKMGEIVLSGLLYLMAILWSVAYVEEQHALSRKNNLSQELVKRKLSCTYEVLPFWIRFQHMQILCW